MTIVYGVAAATFLVLSIGAVFACKLVARDQAFKDAEEMAGRLANHVVSPLLQGALQPGSAQQIELNRAIADRIGDGYLRDAMVWDADGRIIWASDPEDLGRAASTPPEVTAAIMNRTVSSDFDQGPEITHPGEIEASAGLVEVYVPFAEGEQPGLAFEAYYDFAHVNDTANSLTRQMLPLVLVPLILLQIIQVPIASSLARRVRRQDIERTLLLERNLSASEKERIRIAADLHDGPIQDLAGIGYALGAIAPAVATQHTDLMGKVQETVHGATESLRRMMVDLYPPDLRAAQLPDTIADLAVPLRDRGLIVDVTVEPVPDVDADSVTALYRVAREALANVVEHAQATHVQVILKMNGTSAGMDRTVLLQIIDNGVGLDLSRLDRRAEGHLGLRLLNDRVQVLGGTLTLSPNPVGGTVVSAMLLVTVAEDSARGFRRLVRFRPSWHWLRRRKAAAVKHFPIS